MGKTDIFVGISMLAFSMTAYIFTLPFPGGESVADGLGPAFFPRLVIICMLLIGMIILLQGLFTLKDAVHLDLRISDLKSPTLLLIITFGYAISMYFLGFFSATPVFLMGAMIIWRVSWHKSIFIALGLTIILYVFFKLILRIPLPKGALFGGF